MNIKFIKNDEFSISKWSGGTTSQLAIYPEFAVYDERDFLWRISSAKVEVDKSTFTKLDDYKRIIMILDGELELIHKDQHSALLNQFESDYFNGEWETTSYGRVVDYNLMMSKSCQGDIEYIKVANTFKQIELCNKINRLEKKNSKKAKKYTQTFYCYSGVISIKLLEDTYIIEKGDFLQVDFDQSDDLKNIEFSLEKVSISPLESLPYAELISAFISY
ncbi:MAG: HutD family protein [Acidaminobacteraceae bacterium]